ncbi:integral membrane protein [Aspergillus sclerotioniger CBS 115572]|uniref:Integral membrane protein n=1 Tax=Aspergillus sclerotioniger CBS 115572 TaxID=1450535 RepID=A0A317VSI6_9EURO|nr:integral membrane protein [Aspergillus sclerotioniger CBS 115572]PWY77283.1 integral membrane protein [Aspergillus sclerotioniger CBS 115572]
MSHTVGIETSRGDFSSITPTDTIQKYVISAFAAITWYNAIELVVLCLTTFQRYQGCYFWSLFITSISLIPHCVGYLLFIFSFGISPYIPVSLIIPTWFCIITGNSLVLWSRLHLLLQAPRLLRALLGMIIIDCIVFQIPTTVLLYGSLNDAPNFARGYDIMERIQLVAFSVQEALLSGIYVWETIKMLRLRPERPRFVILTQLLVINILILILDVAVVAIEYAGYYALQVMFKPVAYSIKLKLEYAILGRLVKIARGTSVCYDPDPLSPSARGFNVTASGYEDSGSNGAGVTIVRHVNSDPIIRRWSGQTHDSLGPC